MADSRSVFIEAEIDEKLPKELTVVDGPSLLSAISMFKDPNIEFEDKRILISEGTETLRFTCSDPSVSRRRMDPRVVDSTALQLDFATKPGKQTVRFTLPEDAAKRLQKGQAVAKATKLAIVVRNRSVCFEAYDHNNTTGSVYTVDLGATELDDLRYEYDLSSWALMPGKYDVVVEVGDKIAVTKLFGDRIKYLISGLKRDVNRGHR